MHRRASGSIVLAGMISVALGGCTGNAGSPTSSQGLIATKGAAEFGVSYARIRPLGAEIAELFDADRRSVGVLKYTNSDPRTTKVLYVPNEGPAQETTIERASDDPQEFLFIPLGSLVTNLLAEDGLRLALKSRNINVIVAKEEKQAVLNPNRWTQQCGPIDTGIMLQTECNILSCNYTSSANMYIGTMTFTGTASAPITQAQCATAGTSSVCFGFTSASFSSASNGTCTCSGGGFGSDFNLIAGCAPRPGDACDLAGRLNTGVSIQNVRRVCNPRGSCVNTNLSAPSCSNCDPNWVTCGQRCPFDGNNQTQGLQRRPFAQNICVNVTSPSSQATNLTCTPDTLNYSAQAGSLVQTPQADTVCRVNATPSGPAACVNANCQYVPWPVVVNHWCGDGTCDLDESVYTCPQDCTTCGNGLCDDTETCITCQQDCGWCPQQ